MTYYQFKKCSKCGHELPLSEFRWLKTQKRHMSSCRECEKSYHRGRYKANGSHYNAAVKRIAYLVEKHGNGVVTDALRLLEEIPNDSTNG